MNEQMRNLGATLLKVFVGAILAQVVTHGDQVLNLDGEAWRSILGAGVAAVAIAAYNWISPKDTRYGNGYVPTSEIKS